MLIHTDFRFKLYHTLDHISTHARCFYFSRFWSLVMLAMCRISECIAHADTSRSQHSATARTSVDMLECIHDIHISLITPTGGSYREKTQHVRQAFCGLGVARMT